jgi:hypothetical protein
VSPRKVTRDPARFEGLYIDVKRFAHNELRLLRYSKITRLKVPLYIDGWHKQDLTSQGLAVDSVVETKFTLCDGIDRLAKATFKLSTSPNYVNLLVLW